MKAGLTHSAGLNTISVRPIRTEIIPSLLSQVRNQLHAPAAFLFKAGVNLQTYTLSKARRLPHDEIFAINHPRVFRAQLP
jgi:hypothetical protein